MKLTATEYSKVLKASTMGLFTRIKLRVIVSKNPKINLFSQASSRILAKRSLLVRCITATGKERLRNTNLGDGGLEYKKTESK